MTERRRQPAPLPASFAGSSEGVSMEPSSSGRYPSPAIRMRHDTVSGGNVCAMRYLD